MGSSEHGGAGSVRLRTAGARGAGDCPYYRSTPPPQGEGAKNYTRRPHTPPPFATDFVAWDGSSLRDERTSPLVRVHGP